MSLKFTAKVISKHFWMKLYKKQKSKRVTYNENVLTERRLQWK
jgi:hypothetical protein